MKHVQDVEEKAKIRQDYLAHLLVSQHRPETNDHQSECQEMDRR